MFFILFLYFYIFFIIYFLITGNSCSVPSTKFLGFFYLRLASVLKQEDNIEPLIAELNEGYNKIKVTNDFKVMVNYPPKYHQNILYTEI